MYQVEYLIERESPEIRLPPGPLSAVAYWRQGGTYRKGKVGRCGIRKDQTPQPASRNLAIPVEAPAECFVDAGREVSKFTCRHGDSRFEHDQTIACATASYKGRQLHGGLAEGGYGNGSKLEYPIM